MRPLGIRWRLTFWYSGLLTLVLLVYSLVVYYTASRLTAIDTALADELSQLRGQVVSANDEVVVRARCIEMFGTRNRFQFEVVNASGNVLFRTLRFANARLSAPPFANEEREDEPRFASEWLPQLGHYRLITEEVDSPAGPLRLRVGTSLAGADQQLSRLEAVLFGAGLTAVVVAMWGGYLIARRAMAPVAAMTEAAAKITMLDLNRRLAIFRKDDEFGRLGETLNRMIERLERSFEEVRRFTADAAHEFRTPMAIMRSEAEIALRSPRSPEEYRRVIESLLEETTHLSGLAEQLLFLCREDAGLISSDFEPVGVCALLEELCEQMRVAAREKEIELESRLEPDCYVSGDPQRLRRLFMNLLDNAIKYTPRGGRIDVSCRGAAGRVVIEIADSGYGIPAESLPHIFERFYRVDAARTGVKGTGLGLAISRSIVDAHGGTIEVESRVGTGSRMRVTLQKAQPPANGKPGASGAKPQLASR